MPLGFYRAVGGVGRRRAPGLQFVTASGGTVSDVTINGINYRLHTFSTAGNGTFTVTSPGKIDVLLVGGGGGPGQQGDVCASGGGGGGVVFESDVNVTNQSYTITVGAGGIRSFSTGGVGTAGTNTTAFSLSAGGGLPGRGGTGNRGGSSGAPQSSQGGRGSTFSNSDFQAGGGGGGAGGPGLNHTDGTSGGAGGPGLANSITGQSQLYAPGGGGRNGGFGSGASSGAGLSIGRGGSVGRSSGTSDGSPGAVIIRYVLN